MAVKEFNVDLDIKGKVSATNVPNSTGSIVTWNTTSKVFGLRTNAQIISDLNLSSSFVPYTGATANVDLGSRSITSTGGFIGNASTATTLATARTINGTSFNGSDNITTANWGTSRDITIGDTTKSVNGSGNVAWSLSEIGASSVSHTHPISDIVGLQTELNKIGNLPSLTTTNKTSLVGAVNEVNNIKIGGRNLLIKSKLIHGYISPDSGNTIQYPPFMYNPDYIPIGNNKNITFKHHKNNGVTNAKAGFCIAFYDENKSFLQGTYKWEMSEGQEIIRAIPLDAKYFRYTVTNINFDSKYEFGNKATDFTPAPEDQVSDWNETDSTKFSFIKNKPTIPTVNNGQLTLSTGTGLNGSTNFTANQAGGSTFSVDVASTHKLPSTAEWEDVLKKDEEFIKNGTGWSLKHRKDNPSFYGTLGQNALDLSYTTSANTFEPDRFSWGSNGLYSFSAGYKNSAMGVGSTVLGTQNYSQGQTNHIISYKGIIREDKGIVNKGKYSNGIFAGELNQINNSIHSVILGGSENSIEGEAEPRTNSSYNSKNAIIGGYKNKIISANGTNKQSYGSVIFGGENNIAQGNYNMIAGYGNHAVTLGETLVGIYGTIQNTSLSGFDFIDNSRMFNVGVGLSQNNGTIIRRDGLSVYRNGLVTTPSLTPELTDTSNRAVVTKEYLDIRIPKPPTTGNYVLKSVDGVVSWVTE